MSFSSAPRGARSGEKGTGTKKAKKKKRGFTTKKKRPVEREQIDVTKAKERVLEGLSHLGMQKFSTGPGNYDLKHWLKSLNLLLDDFEDKAKEVNLPPEYKEKRKEIEARFSADVDTSQIESEVESIKKEEIEIRSTFEREKERIISRLDAIKVEKDGKTKEVEEQKAELERIRTTRKNASFFAKLMGRSGPPTEPVEKKIGEIEKAVSSLEEEGMNLSKVRASIEREGGTPSGLYEQQWLRIDAIKARLTQLDSEMQEKTQLAKEREEATSSLAALISKIEIVAPAK